MIATVALWLALATCATADSPSRLDAMGPEWEGLAISYSGYREGQSPRDGVYPSQTEILEDLRILDKKWSLIRTYTTDQHSRDVLEVIRREGLGLKVMLGAYFAREPGGEAENEQQILDCIELANAYPDIVVAINVGNEALIDWSFSPVPEYRVKRFVRQVRKAVSIPVTVADNYVYWRDHGKDLAELLDFVTVHTYPIWEKKDIDGGLSYTIQNVDEVRQAIPGKKIVIGEAGWATYAVGNQHVPRAGDEEKQLRYFKELMEWGREEGIPVFWFEAFDEPWKGEGTEGHWGLFDVHRKAKLAMHEWYPELVAEAATSPDYSDEDLRAGRSIAAALNEDLVPLVGSGGVNTAGGWDDVVSVGESDDAVSGDRSLKMTHNGADWGGVFLYLDTPFDVSGYTEMKVSLKLPPEVVELQIKLESPGGRGQEVSLRRFDRRDLSDGWIDASIPLKKFKKTDLSEVVIIGFWHPRDKWDKYVAGDVLINNIRFE
jgi:exo-beta-1,3-glucanase (GH17 family)